MGKKKEQKAVESKLVTPELVGVDVPLKVHDENVERIADILENAILFAKLAVLGWMGFAVIILILRIKQVI